MQVINLGDDFQKYCESWESKIKKGGKAPKIVLMNNANEAYPFGGPRRDCCEHTSELSY